MIEDIKSDMQKIIELEEAHCEKEKCYLQIISSDAKELTTREGAKAFIPRAAGVQYRVDVENTPSEKRVGAIITATRDLGDGYIETITKIVGDVREI
jgi:hypothetical protein